MLNVIAVGGAVLSLLAPWSVEPGAVPTLAPPSSEVGITKVKFNGSGCKKTAVVALSGDRQAFTVTYSDYLAQVGPGSKPKEDTKDCKLQVTVKLPRGYQYAISQVDYRGFAQLAKGVSAYESASYHIIGNARPKVSHALPGSTDGDWQFTDVMAPGDLDYGHCGQVHKMTIDTEVGVRASTSNPQETSTIAMDSVDGSVRYEDTYHISWKTC